MRPPRKVMPALLPPLSLKDCLKAVCFASESYVEATKLPAKWTNKPWFVVEFAKYVQNSCCPGTVYVDTDDENFRVSQFYFAAGENPSLRPDLVVSERWGSGSHLEDDFGKGEEFLPPFHVVKIFVNTDNYWPLPSQIADTIKGPLTVSLVWISNVGFDARGLQPILFKSKMENAGVAHALSNDLLTPGFMIDTKSLEISAHFQVFVASQTFSREQERNPLFEPSKARDPRRPLRR